jgi:hypothetical protein
MYIKFRAVHREKSHGRLDEVERKMPSIRPRAQATNRLYPFMRNPGAIHATDFTKRDKKTDISLGSRGGTLEWI